MSKRRFNSQGVKYYGKTYRSKLEVSVVKQLLKKRKELSTFDFKYECETIPYVQPEKQRTYLPDFKIVRKDGSVLYIEVKGVLDLDTQMKMRLVKLCNPTINIAFLFQKDNLIRKGGKMRYSDWCEKYGFGWAIGDVPERWL
jgi:hypothetical protein